MSRWLAGIGNVYTLSSRVKSTIKLKYGIIIQSGLKISTYLGYSFKWLTAPTRNRIQVGRMSAATQKIMNRFPRWTTMRLDPQSMGYKIMASVGQNIEHLYENILSMRNEMFIGTADQAQSYQLYQFSNERIGQIALDKAVAQADSYRNLLANSDFSLLQPRRTLKAFKWTGQYTVTDTKSAYGTYSAKLTPTASISQFVTDVIDTNNPLVFSFYHQTNSAVSIEDDLVYAALIHFVYEDDTRKIIRQAIPSYTSSSWKRFSFSVTPEKRVTRIEVQIILRPNSYVSEAYIDCLQLEINDSTTAWIARADDRQWFMDTFQLPRVQASKGNQSLKKISIYMSDDDYEFQYKLPPTRAELETVFEDESALTRSHWGRIIDYTKDEHPMKWIVDRETVKRESVTVPGEIPFSYNLAELAPDEMKMVVYDDVTRTNLALATYRDLLYVLSKEIYEGNTKYFLKVVKPHVAVYTDTHLEVLADLELQLSSWIQDLSPFHSYPSGSYQMGIATSRPDLLAIQLPAGQILLYKLYFDYGFIDLTDATLYLREDYKSLGCSVTTL